MTLSPARVSATDLATLDAMEQDALDAIEAVRDPDEAEALLLRVKAVHEAQRLARLGAEYEKRWSSVRLRAERRYGELLGPATIGGQRDGHVTQSHVEPAERKQAERARQVAAVPDEVFETFIEEAEEPSRAALLRKARAAGNADNDARPPAAMPDGRFDLILADPPWRYEGVEAQSNQIENHYPTMTLEAICDLKPPAADDALLFLWGTAPKLPEAMRVIEAWGFNYRTCMVWVKDRIGMGYYARGRHELLLIGKRGNASPPPPDRRPDSVIEAPRGKHSEKPALAYEVIESMYPDARRLELFCRNPREGWVAWGNEVPTAA